MMPDEPTRNPLLKEVPTHLFRFEEKIFGMTLPQLLCDLGGFLLLASITGGLPVLPRIVVCACSGLLVLVLVPGIVKACSASRCHPQCSFRRWPRVDSRAVLPPPANASRDSPFRQYSSHEG